MTEVALTVAMRLPSYDTLDSSFQREIIKNLVEAARRLNRIDCLIVGFYPTPVSRALFEILTTRAASTGFSRFSDGRWVESTKLF